MLYCGNMPRAALPTAVELCVPEDIYTYNSSGLVQGANSIVSAVNSGQFSWSDLHSYDSISVSFLQQAPFNHLNWVTAIATIRQNCPDIKIVANTRWDLWWGTNFGNPSLDNPPLAWGSPACPKPTVAMGSIPRDFINDPVSLDANGNPIAGTGSGLTWAQAVVILNNNGWTWNAANKAAFDDASGNTCITNPYRFTLDVANMEFSVAGNQMDVTNPDWINLICDHQAALMAFYDVDCIQIDPVKIQHTRQGGAIARARTFNHYLTQTGGTGGVQGPAGNGGPDDNYDIVNNLPAWIPDAPFDDKPYNVYDIVKASFEMARCLKAKGLCVYYGCEYLNIETWRNGTHWFQYLAQYQNANPGSTATDAENFWYDELTAMKAEMDGFICPTSDGTLDADDKDQQWVDNLADCDSGATVINNPSTNQTVPL